MNKQNKETEKQLIDTRQQYGVYWRRTGCREVEEGKGGQKYGEKRSLDFGW